MSAYIPYAQRPEWADLIPIPQNDAPNAMVPIAYTERYRDAMDTFRALANADEKSERGLELMEVIIRINPGHYSIWAYRAKTLIELGSNLNKELDLLDNLVKECLKSYQVWQHRKTIVTYLNRSDRELAFTSRALTYDAKNYHTWAYRQWVLCHFFLPSLTIEAEHPPLGSPNSTKVVPILSESESNTIWDEEISYIEQLLETDVRNNSAWNHRYFVVFHCGGARSGLRDEQARGREIAFSKQKLALAPNNPSAWNYLRGILSNSQTPFATLEAFVAPMAFPGSSTTNSTEETEKFKITPHAYLPANLAIEFMADVFLEQGKREESAALFRSLKQYDPIRRFYWELRAEECLTETVST